MAALRSRHDPRRGGAAQAGEVRTGCTRRAAHPAIANALDGMSREDAARSAGMDRQTLRDWVIRYDEHGLDGLADRWAAGRPPKLDRQRRPSCW